jgi:hypothetical protein
MSIINKQGGGPEQWNLLIDGCITWISDLESDRLLWKWYIADKTNLESQRLQGALDEFAEVCRCQRNNKLTETPTKNRELVHIGMYFITLKLLLLFLRMCRSKRQRGWNLGSWDFADRGMLRSLN